MKGCTQGVCESWAGFGHSGPDCGQVRPKLGMREGAPRASAYVTAFRFSPLPCHSSSRRYAAPMPIFGAFVDAFLAACRAARAALMQANIYDDEDLCAGSVRRFVPLIRRTSRAIEFENLVVVTLGRHANPQDNPKVIGLAVR